MAANGKRGTAIDAAAIPLAHGGPECGTAEGSQAGPRVGKHLRMLDEFRAFSVVCGKIIAKKLTRCNRDEKSVSKIMLILSLFFWNRHNL